MAALRANRLHRRERRGHFGPNGWVPHWPVLPPNEDTVRGRPCTTKRTFTVQTLVDELEVGPLPVTNTVRDLRITIAQQLGCAKVALRLADGTVPGPYLGGPDLSDDNLPLWAIPEDGALVAAAVVTPLVVHNGSFNLSLGFSGYDAPQVVMPSPLRDMQGYINFIDLEKVWRQAFLSIGLSHLAGCNVVVSVPMMAPAKHRENIARILVDDLGAEQVITENPQVLALHATGKMCGVVLDIGARGFVLTRIASGVHCPRDTVWSSAGGEALTEALGRWLHRRRLWPTLDELRVLKEEECFVAFDPAWERRKRWLAAKEAKRLGVKLPVGRLDSESFEVPELLFHFTSNRAHLPVQKAFLRLFNLMGNLDRDRYAGHMNVLAVGGTAMLPGFRERLTKELMMLLQPEGVALRMEVSPRGLAPWLGGCAYADKVAWNNAEVEVPAPIEYFVPEVPEDWVELNE